MEPFIDQLKRAREARGMSLTDIADATLINPRFLEELEQGNFAFLPQTYVRAFLREYALQVDLDPDDICRAYDASRKTRPNTKGEKEPKEQTREPIPFEEVPPPPILPSGSDRAEAAPMNPKLTKAALVLVLVLAVAVAVWNLVTPSADRAVEEIPFESVMKENESRETPADSTADSARSLANGRMDSLILQATTADTVWVQLAIDGGTPRDYMLQPNVRRSWKAANRFGVTVGNASNVEFTLNKKQLGKLGKPGAVVRNVQLNRSTLDSK